MKFNKTLIALLVSTSLLSACSDDKKPINVTDNVKYLPNRTTGASTNGFNNGAGVNAYGLNTDGMSGAGSGAAYNDPNSPQAKVIYFMLDSSEVQPDFLPVVLAHAQYLVANPRIHIILEGNSDERGSREYNVALGEQRARSVANIMKAHGVSDSQLQTVSYGEEKPAAMGSDESAWEQNRRVEIVYTR
ncbi:MAG: peptidoglycan-associated lipoprotein Pal [Methylococcales bacterium]|nr:peptidoglycan-associated lipoprotein Pal [Methylococcales bacterium]